MNIKLSKRVMDLEESPTLAITAKAKALKAQGIDVIGFGAGEPDFDTPQNIKDAAIRAINEGKTKYTAVGGIDELKRAVVEKLKRDNDLDYEMENVSVNCGGKHSFYNLCQAMLNDGDEVIIPAPYWVSYPPMVELALGKSVIIETTQAEGFKITPEQLKNAVNDKTKMFLINSPSNPSGAVYSKDELEALCEVVKGKDILIVSDEIYEQLVYDNGGEFTSPANLGEVIKEQTIILNGVSKAYSMTGWRIGYTVGNTQVIKAMNKIQSQSTSNPTSISQWASVEALGGNQCEVATMKEAFLKRRSLMVELLNEIPGIKCLTPGGAFYTFPDVSELFGKESDKGKIGSAEGLADYLLRVAKVAVVPGEGFGAPNNMRLSYAMGEDSIKEGIKRIKEAVEKLK